MRFWDNTSALRVRPLRFARISGEPANLSRKSSSVFGMESVAIWSPAMGVGARSLGSWRFWLWGQTSWQMSQP